LKDERHSHQDQREEGRPRSEEPPHDRQQESCRSPRLLPLLPLLPLSLRISVFQPFLTPPHTKETINMKTETKVAAKKAVREVKNLRTTDSKKVAEHSHCCRCCRCCRCW
jgi:hypothetical protein